MLGVRGADADVALARSRMHALAEMLSASAARRPDDVVFR